MKRIAQYLWILIVALFVIGFALQAEARPQVLNDKFTVDTGGIINVEGGALQLDGVEVTSTAAELNAVDGITATVTEINVLDGVLDGIGAKTGTTVTATESLGYLQKTVIVLADTPVVMAEGGTGTNGVGSVKLYDFPEGRIKVDGVTVDNITVTVDTNALDNADGGDFAFGSAAAAGASGLSSTEVDFCPSTSVDPITNVTDSALVASAHFDGTTTAKDLYLNMEVDDGDIAAACTNTISGTVTIHWLNLGDY